MHNPYGDQAGSSGAQAVARGLGWFSIALGLAELAAPRTLTRTLGLDGQETLVRAYGLREIATGTAIRAANDPTPWVWGRVAGDALDMATLGAGYRGSNGTSRNVSLALAAVAGVTALDVWCARALGEEGPQRRLPKRDYRDRSGFPRPPSQMRGAARDRVTIPEDMRAPAAMRPYAAD